MEKKETSWGWIIFWMIIFWPVGLFLIIRKMSTDKSVLMSGKTGAISAVGWILVAIGAAGGMSFAIAPEEGMEGPMLLAFIFVVGGVLTLRKASQIKRTSAKYRKYINLAVNEDVSDIDDIAASIGLSYEAAAKDLQNMIDKGYLKDGYIYQSSREFVFRRNDSEEYDEEPTNGRAASQKIAVRCSGCGANNVVAVGGVSECEYCGTPINA